MYLYVDIFLCLNFMINFIHYIFVAKLCGLAIVWWRFLISAISGSCYALYLFYLDSEFFYSAPMKLIVSVILIYIAFSPRDLRRLLQLTVAYYFACFATGGVVSGLYYYRQTSIANALSFHNTINWQDLLCGALLTVVLLFVVKSSFFRKLLSEQCVCLTELSYNDQMVTIKGIVDTGNSLYSSTQKPVIVVDKDAVLPILSLATKDFLDSNSPNTWPINLHQCADKQWLERVELIPFRAVGGGAILIAFRPDLVRLYLPKQVIATNEVLIAIHNGCLSSTQHYSALLHPAMLQFSVEEEVAICAPIG